MRINSSPLPTTSPSQCLKVVYPKMRQKPSLVLWENLRYTIPKVAICGILGILIHESSSDRIVWLALHIPFVSRLSFFLAKVSSTFDQIVAPKQHDGNLAMVKHLFGGFPSPMLVHQVSSCHLQVHLNQGHETWTPIQSSSNDQSLSFQHFSTGFHCRSLLAVKLK